MRLSFRTISVVFAMLRPPATFCHPFGMNCNDSKTPGDSFPPKSPHGLSFARDGIQLALQRFRFDFALRVFPIELCGVSE